MSKPDKDETTAPAVGLPVERRVSPLLERLRAASMGRVVPGYSKRALIAEAAVAMQTYEDMLFARGGMDDAPCFCCGYNGRGYYQPDTHPCAKRHHALRANTQANARLTAQEE